jgi:bifunctional enzyme CysN/CysC
MPSVARTLDAYLCWTDVAPLQLGPSYVFRQTTREVRATVDSIEYRMDVDSLHRETGVSALGLNDIGRVTFTTADAVFFDSYRSNSATGSFILIDPRTNLTVAAGMIRGASASGESRHTRAPGGRSPDVVRQTANIPVETREERNGHLAGVIWLTGLPGSGKSTIARAVERQLFDSNHQVTLIDGDDLRHGLSSDLGFSPSDRTENIRRAGEVARLLFDHGAVVLCAFVSPYRADRARVRALLPADRFVEIFVKATIETCRRRDPKGHYQRAGAGDVKQFTGVSAPYEEPTAPELVVDTEQAKADEAAAQIVSLLRGRGWLRR